MWASSAWPAADSMPSPSDVVAAYAWARRRWLRCPSAREASWTRWPVGGSSAATRAAIGWSTCSGTGPVVGRPAATSCSANRGLPWLSSTARSTCSGVGDPTRSVTRAETSSRPKRRQGDPVRAGECGKVGGERHGGRVDGRVMGTDRDDGEQPARTCDPEEVGEQIAAGGVDPMQVLDDQPDEPVVGEALQRGNVGRQQPQWVGPESPIPAGAQRGERGRVRASGCADRIPSEVAHKASKCVGRGAVRELPAGELNPMPDRDHVLGFRYAASASATSLLFPIPASPSTSTAIRSPSRAGRRTRPAGTTLRPGPRSDPSSTHDPSLTRPGPGVSLFIRFAARHWGLKEQALRCWESLLADEFPGILTDRQAVLACGRAHRPRHRRHWDYPRTARCGPVSPRGCRTWITLHAG